MHKVSLGLVVPQADAGHDRSCAPFAAGITADRIEPRRRHIDIADRDVGRDLRHDCRLVVAKCRLGSSSRGGSDGFGGEARCLG